MKKQRLQFIILAAICLLSAGGYFLIRGHEFETDEEVVKTQVTDFAPEDVTELIVTGDHELHFVKTDKEWNETSLDGVSVDQDSVNLLLEQISGITTTETVIRAPEDREQYGLSDPFCTIEAVLSDGSSVTVYVGEESSLLSKYYVRVEGDDNVYLITSSIVTDFDQTAEAFIQEQETESKTAETDEGTLSEIEMPESETIAENSTE